MKELSRPPNTKSSHASHFGFIKTLQTATNVKVGKRLYMLGTWASGEHTHLINREGLVHTTVKIKIKN